MNQNLLKDELRQIGFEYAKLLLEIKYGCRVKQGGATLEVWSPKGYSKNTMQVNVENNESETVAILIARIINGRKVPIIVDYHLIKFIGVEGIYSLEEEKLQQLLLDDEIEQVTFEDGSNLYSVFGRQLLLDYCSYVPA